MEKIDQVGHCRPESLDSELVDRADARENFRCCRTTAAVMQEPAESALIGRVFVDVRDAKFGLPEEGMVRALEDLPLFGHRMNDRLQRRPAIGHAEPACFDLLDDLADAATDGAEILQTLVPQEPSLVGRSRVAPPLFNKITNSI